jgi:hypothetical protein
MKRKEMIEHINDFLEKNGKPDSFGKRALATQFLSFIESKGMQPPSIVVVKKFRQWDKGVKMYLSREVGEIENKWEPENEEK